jgi:ABC-type transport system substrate-binding protein
MYAWGRYEWVKWGSISIGMVGTTAKVMDPFGYGSDDATDLVYRFLFRWLVRYDIATSVYTGDLTNCDLRDMTNISCTLRDDAVWSDGTRIKLDDIIASIDTFRRTASNSDIRTLLQSVSVSKDGESINIKSTQKSPYMIEVLTYPVVRSDVIAAIGSGTITTKNYITSGPYILSETVTDPEYGYDRITLVRNDKWAGVTWLDKISFKFFKDLTSLERSAETLTIVIPPVKNENLELGRRFREYLYTNYEYFGVFLNTKSMSRILRNTLHWQIGTSFSGNIIDDHKRVDTIFQSGSALLPTDGLKWFSDVLRELGYIKKSEMISKLNQASTTVSGEAVYPIAKYWSNKADVTTLLIDTPTTELVLTGKVPASTTSVSVNGYILQEFAPGNTTFAYKVSTASGTIRDGLNTYILNVGQSDNNTDTETLSIYLSTDSTKMTEYKKQIQDTYNAAQNTPALMAAREREKWEKMKLLQTLADEYYYNDKNEIFQVRIGYVSGPQSTEAYGTSIDKALRLLGVKTELIPYGPKEIQSMIASGERKYDLLVIGVSVEWSLSGIGQLFSASENRPGGVNFSNVENRSLDTLFAQLRGTTDPSKRVTIEQSIAKIINTESFFVPISSPYHRIWIDRNISGIAQVDIIPDIASLEWVLVGTSIVENYIRDPNKSVAGFLGWIRSKL